MAAVDLTPGVKDTNADILRFEGLADEPWCFYCGGGMGEATGQLRLVMWRGNGAPNDDLPTIFLHPHCAQSLGCHLIADAIRATKPFTCRQVLGWPGVLDPEPPHADQA